MGFPVPQTSLASDWIEFEVGAGGGLCSSQRLGHAPPHGGKSLGAKRRLAVNRLRLETQYRRSIEGELICAVIDPITSNTSSPATTRQPGYGVFTP
jgi:hypothetical protein